LRAPTFVLVDPRQVGLVLPRGIADQRSAEVKRPQSDSRCGGFDAQIGRDAMRVDDECQRRGRSEKGAVSEQLTNALALLAHLHLDPPADLAPFHDRDVHPATSETNLNPGEEPPLAEILSDQANGMVVARSLGSPDAHANRRLASISTSSSTSSIATSAVLTRKPIGLPGLLDQEEIEGLGGRVRDPLEHRGARAVLAAFEPDQVMAGCSDGFAECVECQFGASPRLPDPRSDELQRRVLDLAGQLLGRHE
jgi:hypothetical protein